MNLPEHLALEVGQTLELRESGGNALPVQVTELTEARVTLDGNHPLAGKDVLFLIQLVAIVRAALGHGEI